jgi:hypothetical protein
LAYKVLDAYGGGHESDVIAGVERAVEDGADIISMSLGISYFWFEDCYEVALSRIVEEAVDAGVTVVVAAGNDYDYETIAAPGCAEKVITVGAVNKTDAIAEFSSKGPVVWGNGTLAKPDVVAPGVDICAAQWDEAWADLECIDAIHISLSGTSMATPHVAGLAAILKQAHQLWAPATLKSAVMGGAMDLGYDSATQGAGRIDATQSYNVSIITNPQTIESTFRGVEPVENHTLIIENLRGYEISLTLTPSLGKDRYGNAFDVATLNVTALTLAGGEEAAVRVILNLTEASGAIFGEIRIEVEGYVHLVPYAASWYVPLNVTAVAGDLELYPDMCVHDDEGNFTRCASQGWEFAGNSYTFWVPPFKNYTAYADGDWRNRSLQYILANRTEVTDSGMLILNLSEARAFTVMAEALDGTPLKLYYWQRGFVTYSDSQFILSYSVIDGGFIQDYGNLTVYLSDKPEGPLQTDVIFKYYGVPVRK